jgi:hypothetical protein
MSKFLLNLLLQFSKALLNSEIQFLFGNSFFFIFGPADLAARQSLTAQPACSPRPWPDGRPEPPGFPGPLAARPARADGVFWVIRFLL